MDSRQMRYFREIVDAGSMSAAARDLGIAQPSLSQMVRNLETSLGIELLTRSARGVAATEAGQTLYSYACRMEELLQEAEREVVGVGSSPAGRVEFGMTPSISMALSIPMAETMRLELPNVQFSANEAMSGHLRDWILAGEIDMAILYDYTDLGQCTSEYLMDEDLWVYAAPDDWPFDVPPGEPVVLSEVLRRELVLPSRRHGLRRFIDRVARSHGLNPTVEIEMDSMPQIKSLVARGSGFTILSPAAVYDMVATGQLMGSPIHEPVLQRQLYLVRSASTRITAALRATEDCCRSVVADLVRRGIWQAKLRDTP
jgi:LysR family transcriptional regulator, nitrogen assimilation regulatory protein